MIHNSERVSECLSNCGILDLTTCLKSIICNLQYTIRIFYLQRSYIYLNECPTEASSNNLTAGLQFTIHNFHLKRSYLSIYIWMNVPLKHPLTTILLAHNLQFTSHVQFKISEKMSAGCLSNCSILNLTTCLPAYNERREVFSVKVHRISICIIKPGT